MKVKTSVTLPAKLLAAIDQADANRSAFLERAARAYLVRLARGRREERDARIINANAGHLNEEAKDVLEYQRFP